MPSLDRRRFFGGVLGGAGALALGATSDPQEAEESIGRTPRTRFAINVEMWFRGMPFLERIRRAGALGFPAVEFWPWRGKNIDEIAAVAKESGVEIAQFTGWGFVPGMNDPKNHDRFLEEIEAGCAVAKRLDCKMMTVIAGNDQRGMSQAEMHGHVVTALKRAAPLAESHDVTLILEPMNIRVDHPGHCLHGSPDAVRICRAVDSTHVKINWDLYHMQITEGDLCGRLKEGFDQVGYLQLADHPGRNEPGTGEINYRRVLREAWELGYRGFVGAECNPKASGVDAARALAAAGTF